jgi:hypothetical protein
MTGTTTATNHISSAPIEADFEDIPRRRSSDQTTKAKIETNPSSNFDHEEGYKENRILRESSRRSKLRAITSLWLLLLTLGLSCLLYIIIIEPSILRDRMALGDAPDIKDGLDKALTAEKVSIANSSAVRAIELAQASTASKVDEATASVEILKAEISDANTIQTQQFGGLTADVQRLKEGAAVSASVAPIADAALETSKAAQAAANANAARLDETAASITKSLKEAKDALRLIEGRIVALEAQKSDQPSNQPSTQLLDKKESSVSTVLENTKVLLENAEGQIATLDTQLNKMTDRSDVHAVVALGNLRRAIESGRPFNEVLLKARKALPGAKLLETSQWVSFAPEGLPKAPQLAHEMGLIAQKIRKDKTHAKRKPSESWITWAKTNVANRLKIRRVSANAEGNDAAAVAARAEAALRADDIEKAISEISTAEAAISKYFSQWLQKAQASKIAAEDIRSLEKSIIATAKGT